jgi:ATP-binding cassette, subfamily B, bacterial PglK
VKINKTYFSKFLFLLGDSKKQAALLIGLFLFSSLLDIIGISIIAPYIALIINPESIATSDLYISLTKWAGINSSKDVIIIVGYLLIIVFIFKAILGIFINKKILTYCYYRGYVIRTSLFSFYQNMPYSEYMSHNKSDFVHRVQELTYIFSQVFLQSILRFVSEIIVAFAILLFLLYKEPYAVLLLLVVLIPIMYIYDLFFKDKVSQLGTVSNQSSKRIIKDVNQGIEGLKEIRILGCENYFYKRVKDGSKRYLRARVKEGVISGIPRYLVESTLVIFLVLLIFSLLSTEAQTNEIFPILSMFGLAAIRLAPSVNQISSGLNQIRYGENTISVLYKDYKKYCSNMGKINKNVGRVNNFKTLELKEIFFSYDGNKLIINGIDLTIKKGDLIGIVGKSGSGKTTLVDLLLGVLNPDSGNIKYNGDELNKNMHEWQSQVAYLPQEAFITDDSLKNNIALGVKEGDINEKLLNNAILKSRLSELVDSWSDGFNTTLGDGGIKLSGGQKQRVALARAFYHQRDILIMDESTSSLDSETESEIVNEIKLLKNSKTIIIIAHRITTLKDCEQIVVIESGKIAKNQTYNEFIEENKNVK